MFKRLLLSTVSVLFIVFGSMTTVFAQGGTGMLDVQFNDEAGSAVAGVSVTISNASSGLTRTVTTNSDGSVRMELPPGTYELSSSASGFNSVVIETVAVRLGGRAKLSVPLVASTIEEIITYGSSRQLMSSATAENSLNISLDEVTRMPVPRNIEAVALLAPSTTPGDVNFGEEKTLVSFGGASVAENAYYINGMNVTNFRNGLGGASVPFEFYDQFQIKSGGYSAEFGRSLGGVLNAVTKTGSNDWNSGIVTYYSPEGARSTSPDTLRSNGDLYDLNSENEGSGYTADVYVSGPIIKDRLFFYALYEQRNATEGFNTRGAPEIWNDREIDNGFWGGNLLWNITDSHSLAYTTFTDERERVNQQYEYDLDALEKGDERGLSTEFRGGTNQILRYDGQWGDSFGVSALYGENNYDLTTVSTTDQDCPYIVDTSDGAIPGNLSLFPGCEANFQIALGGDTREAYRLDLTWYLGNHTIRGGLDSETNTSNSASTYSGTDFRTDGSKGVYYRYYTWPVGTVLANQGTVLDYNGDGTDVQGIRYRLSEVGGAFETNSTAWYIEDTWDISANLTVSVGIRNETFENLNGNGEGFVKIEDQWGPRLAASWSPSGDADSRVYATWGRYHIPVANNTNVRLSGAELGIQRFFAFDGAYDEPSFAPTNRDAEGVPTSTEVGEVIVFANGVTPDSSQLSDQNLRPMYHDEFILGYERGFGDGWLGGISYIQRDLASTVDDILIDEAVDALGYAHTGDAGGYVLSNPGFDVTIPYDQGMADPDEFLGDGTTANPCYQRTDHIVDASGTTHCAVASGMLQETVFPADLLGYPKGDRTYKAVEFTIERATEQFNLIGSYVYAKNRGNTEGYVKSDNGQDDAGITQDFDQPSLMDGAYGYLPNDRRHSLKLFGSYYATDRLLLGSNILMQSGRPTNAFGIEHPSGTPIYGDTYYVTNATTGDLNFIPRGTYGRTDTVFRIDVSAIYSFNWADRADVELRAEIFNLLDASATTEVYEFAELSAGVPDNRLGASTAYQTPRYLRLGATIRF
jgi:hypothetical protein